MVVSRVRQVVVLCSVNTTKYYLGGLVSGRFEEVVFNTDSTLAITVITQFKNSSYSEPHKVLKGYRNVTQVTNGLRFVFW